jgi:hypothetical protein
VTGVTGGATVSPFVTVIVLTILWLVVVVPMIVRRGDEAARTRSLSRLRAGKRAIGPVSVATASVGPSPLHGGKSASIEAPVGGSRRTVAESGADGSSRMLADAVRRPVLAAEEATMRSVQPPEMSAPREAMMRRRRRSLSILGVGSVITVLLAAVTGGASWLVAGAFVLGLVGYLYSLRKQALRDRDRRAARQLRAAHRPSEVDDTRPAFVRAPDSMVRIDDEDIELYAMDTVDLTGVYDDGIEYAEEQRRAG